MSSRITHFFSEHPVLLVDDEVNILQSFETILRSRGIDNIVCCDDSREAHKLLEQEPFSAALIDLAMPHVTGQELLQQIVANRPEIPVIVVTGANDLPTAISCMKMGAYDYILKPPDHEVLLSSVSRAIEVGGLREENEELKSRVLSDELAKPQNFSDIVSRSPAMMSLFRYIETVARTRHPILITGETGTGKELIAKAIHKASGLADEFVAVNIGGLDDHTLSDSLFGHKKGAFTGAIERRDGLVRRASGGTLFLDEIGDMSPASQVKLLRLLQEGEYFPLGSDVAQLSSARVFASTHRDVEELRTTGDFRADLYYRFAAHRIHVPPLRERKEDIPLLLDYFVEQFCEEMNKEVPAIPRRLLPMLAAYDFPGNIRELKAMVLDAVSSHHAGPLPAQPFDSAIGASNDFATSASVALDAAELFENLSVLPSLKEASELVVREAMRRSGGNQTLAARLLAISQSALSQRLKKLDEGK